MKESRGQVEAPPISQFVMSSLQGTCHKLPAIVRLVKIPFGHLVVGITHNNDTQSTL